MFGFGKPKGPLKRSQVERMLENSDSLANADLTGLDLSNLEFSQTNLRGARLTSARGRNVEFSQCDLRGAILDGIALEQSEFSQCELHQTSFLGAQLVAVTFSQCELHGSSIGAALKLERCEFSQCEGISGLKPEQLHQDFSDMDSDRAFALGQERMRALAALVHGKYKDRRGDDALEVVGEFQGRAYRVTLDLDFGHVEAELRCRNSLGQIDIQHDPEASSTPDDVDEWDHDRAQRIFLARGTYVDTTVSQAASVQQLLQALPGFGAHVGAWMPSLGLESLSLGEDSVSSRFQEDLLRLDLLKQIPQLLGFMASITTHLER
jgi:hypothetical protein